MRLSFNLRDFTISYASFSDFNDVDLVRSDVQYFQSFFNNKSDFVCPSLIHALSDFVKDDNTEISLFSLNNPSIYKTVSVRYFSLGFTVAFLFDVTRLDI